MFKITAVAISVLAFQEVFGERLHVALIAEFEASRHVVFVMFPSRTRERACGVMKAFEAALSSVNMPSISRTSRTLTT